MLWARQQLLIVLHRWTNCKPILTIWRRSLDIGPSLERITGNLNLQAIRLQSVLLNAPMVINGYWPIGSHIKHTVFGNLSLVTVYQQLCIASIVWPEWAYMIWHSFLMFKFRWIDGLIIMANLTARHVTKVGSFIEATNWIANIDTTGLGVFNAIAVWPNGSVWHKSNPNYEVAMEEEQVIQIEINVYLLEMIEVD